MTRSSRAFSVIILNWNRSEMTLACVRYVLRHTAAHSFEVIVADNGSDPEDFAILQQAELPIRIIALGANLYFGEANNIAAERARGEYLFFLNNDAFVHDGWLAPLVAAIEGVPEAAAAGSQLRYPDGSLQEAGSLISPDGVSNQIGKGEDPADIRFNSMRRVDYVSAAAMLVRRRDFLGVLGFRALLRARLLRGRRSLHEAAGAWRGHRLLPGLGGEPCRERDQPGRTPRIAAGQLDTSQPLHLRQTLGRVSVGPSSAFGDATAV